MVDPAMTLKGNHNPITKMWTVNIENTLNQTKARVQSTRLMENNVYKYKKKRDIVTYLHKSDFSSVKSTWMQAIQAGFFTTCPGLTAELIDKASKKISSHSQRPSPTNSAKYSEHKNK